MVPDIIVLVPYRNREKHKNFFERHIKYVLEGKNYEYFFCHQCDNRSFNRGAIKNIGFMAIKKKYPDHYKTITITFNDVDCLPFYPNQLDYKTTTGTIKHYYGFKYALGGIVSITGQDFEKMNGYPNYWSWGYEDNSLNDRAIHNNIIVDRSVFYDILDEDIIHFQHGYKRNFNNKMPKYYLKNKLIGGLNTLHNVNFSIKDNFIDITNFECELKENITGYHDLRNGMKHKIERGAGLMSMRFI